MPPVQKAALAMLPKLAPTHLPQVCLLPLLEVLNVTFQSSTLLYDLRCTCHMAHWTLPSPSLVLCHIPFPPVLPVQLYPDYIYSIVRLLRPEHVIEQWQEQQAEAAERAAAAAAAQQQFSIPSHPGTDTQAAGAAAPAGSASAGPAAEGPLLPTTATVKQPPGQVAQAKFALTSAFLEKVCWGVGNHGLLGCAK